MTLDIILLLFVCAAIGGVAWLVAFFQFQQDSPLRRIKKRMNQLTSQIFQEQTDMADSALIHKKKGSSWIEQKFRYMMSRLMVIGGYRIIFVLLFGSTIVGIAAFWVSANIFILNEILSASASILTISFFIYVVLGIVENYRYNKLLDSFPEALDYVIRSVRAGIPTGQAISMAGDEVSGLIGEEFRIIGDGLLIGRDIREVLEEAKHRIASPDFTFFTVCLTLQRETGGPLTATLENLSTILRQRKGMRLKIRALSSEGRASVWLVSALPVFASLGLWFFDREYLDLLFSTPEGRKMLILAIVLILLGLFTTNRLTKLD